MATLNKVEAEIKALKEAVGDKILKVIIETCYLTDDEKVKLCQCVTNAKADYNQNFYWFWNWRSND